MYSVELSEAALNDLRDFNYLEALDILGSLQSLEDTPKPEDAHVIPLAEAADGLAYFIETSQFSIYYNIFESRSLIKVVAIFKKIILN